MNLVAGILKFEEIKSYKPPFARTGLVQVKGKLSLLGSLAGGALAERTAEGHFRSDTTYKVTIAMEDGRSREITLQQTGGLAVGAKVRVNGNTISPR